MKCLRCGADMRYLREETIQLGEYGFFAGHLGNLLSGGLDVRIYACPECGKLEFFQPGFQRERDPNADPAGFYVPGMGPDVKCPQCGKNHPADDPFCPLCGTKTVRKRKCRWCGEDFPEGEETCPTAETGNERKRTALGRALRLLKKSNGTFSTA